MKTIAAAVIGVVSVSIMISAGEKKTNLTFLDTLNKGKEISITDADFNPPPSTPSPAAAKPPEPAPVDTASANSRKPAKHESGVVVSLFRIQVLASTQQDQVKRVKDALASKINVPVSISFEPPYYKLFAGEFTQRSEAENYLAQVKKMGYNDAWISRTAATQK